MSAETPVHQGGCLCGGVRYRVRGPLRGVVVCHCGRCRRTHGHVAAYTSCPERALEITERGTLRWYEADGRGRGFCSGCGASLFWRLLDGDDDEISIAAGTLDPPTGLRIEAEIFTDHRGDYYELLESVPRHPDGRRSAPADAAPTTEGS